MKTIKFPLRAYLVSNIVRNSLKIIYFIHNMLVSFWQKETKFNTRLTFTTIYQIKLFLSYIIVSYQLKSSMTVLNLSNSSSAN